MNLEVILSFPLELNNSETYDMDYHNVPGRLKAKFEDQNVLNEKSKFKYSNENSERLIDLSKIEYKSKCHTFSLTFCA